MNIGIIGARLIVPTFLDAVSQVEGMNVIAIAGRGSRKDLCEGVEQSLKDWIYETA